MPSVQTGIELAPFNTFRVSAKARRFLVLSDLSVLSVLTALTQNEPVFFLGAGANTLFVGDFPGLVVKNELSGRKIIKEDSRSVTIELASGENWPETVSWAAEHDLSGIENLAGIPGTVGGALVGNIGAYGQTFADILVSAKSGKEIFTKDQCRLCYRESIFKNKLKNSFVENVVIKLSRNPGARETAQKTIALRQEKLPDWQKIGTAGSFFKNPFVPRAKYRQLLKEIPDLPAYSDTPDAPDASAGAVKIPAGRLLDELGWKGKRTGRVGTWPKHALVIVNYGGATGQEILDFATAMQADIKKNYDLVLEPEVNIVNPSSANNPKLCTHPPLP